MILSEPNPWSRRSQNAVLSENGFSGSFFLFTIAYHSVIDTLTTIIILLDLLPKDALIKPKVVSLDRPPANSPIDIYYGETRSLVGDISFNYKGVCANGFLISSKEYGI